MPPSLSLSLSLSTPPPLCCLMTDQLPAGVRLDGDLRSHVCAVPQLPVPHRHCWTSNARRAGADDDYAFGYAYAV